MLPKGGNVGGRGYGVGMSEDNGVIICYDKEVV